MKALGWLAGIAAVVVAVFLVVSALRAYAFSDSPEPAPFALPPLSATPVQDSCHSDAANEIACSFVLSASPYAYGASPSDVRQQIVASWCAGLVQNHVTAPVQARAHLLNPDGTAYRDFVFSSNECL